MTGTPGSSAEPFLLRTALEDFVWLDYAAPTPAQLSSLAEQYGLHPATIEAALDPEHLPKIERIGDVDFLILRAFDPAAGPESESIHALTRKVVVFFSSRFLITLHRADLPWLAALRAKWLARGAAFQAKSRFHVLGDLIRGSLESYETPIEQAFSLAEEQEEALLASPRARADLAEIHCLRRRCTSLKRVLRLSMETLQRLPIESKGAAPFFFGLRELAESLYLYVDDLQENLQQLLHLHLALVSQRTNETMRVLTVFSAFFLPLTFIAGIYGMNFHHMPELEWAAGYPFALGVMAAAASVIAVWFRKRGWLGREDEENSA